MTKAELYKELNYVNHSRDMRLKYAHLIIDNPELVAPLLDILFEVDDKISCRAAWVLEFMCGEHLNAIIPHLDTFTQNISIVHLDPAVRPVAKICEYLTKAYYSKTDNAIKSALSENHRENIVAACFDWMINDEKIAPKAYSMNSLYLLGTEYDWIHPELAIILERDYEMQSSGFKARAKHILKKIKNR
ncbi:adenylosuccinate lyase [Winogradskyella psychrotolerans]|uniref:adenylosuccinate lyase n=1 Tax=Winogradskyella psychrotolerans TaxID=1344585 RepID=UPI001C078D27|nr:adenylosuccinate lyase [Winogradskyella psychrotolerans]MBU2929363.1 adenylosuccinate lyase [Winogradskyella psychrotolerans]